MRTRHTARGTSIQCMSLGTGSSGSRAYNMGVIFSISALVGIPMRYSGLFPILDKYYYQVMPRIQSYVADGLSGLMVAIVYYFFLGEIKPEQAFLYALPVALAFKPHFIGINI